ncbi:tape measure protein [Marinobacter alexandrii]|uniref:tape measure protein n=1 Tax=Marinobacter alexandrii TaxID=2570351 RepID=UPI001108C549|nr:tape measure protein [Marinobacter alexandrii]
MEDLASLGFSVDSSGIKGATRELRKMDSAQERAERSNKQLTTASNALKAALAGVVASIGVREIIQYADGWQNVANQLRQVTDSTRELETIQGRLVDVAKDTRSNFESTANLYARLARSTTEMNLSQEDLIGLTTTINQSFATSGATAEEAAASITQLSQGLASGALRGDEFNSVSEQAPGIMRAVADSLNMTKGELREFAAEGGITAEIVVNALREASDEIDQNFGKTVATFGQSIEVARTELIKWVGENKAISQSVSFAGEAIVTLSENIDELVTVAGAGLLVFLARTAGGLEVSAAKAIKKQAAMVSLARQTAQATGAEAAYLRVVQGSLSAELAATTSTTRKIALRQQLAANTTALTVAQNRYTAALSASTVAARASTVAMTAARGAMALLGGPVGIALIAAGSMYYFRDSLFETKVELGETGKELRAYTKDLNSLTDAQVENRRQSLAEAMRQNKLAISEAAAELERLKEIQASQSVRFQGRPGSAAPDLANVEAELARLERAGEIMSEQYRQLEDRREALTDSTARDEAQRAQSATDAVQKIISGLQDEYLQLTLNEEQLLRHKLAIQGASEAEVQLAVDTLRSARAIEEQRKQQDALSEMRRDLDPAFAEFDRYADQVDAIEAFNITAEEKERLREEAFLVHQERMAEIANEGVSKRAEVEKTYWQQWIESAERNLTNFDELSKTVIDNFTRSFGDAFEAVILDSENTEEALKGMARTMIRSVVNSIGQMIAQWVALQAVQMALGTSATAATVGQAAVASAAWAPAAAMASLATVGTNAAPAAAALASTTTLAQSLAMIGGSFEGGGYTGNGPRSSGLDGKGGFLAMLHPDETVIDHRRGDSGRSAGGNGGDTNITQVLQIPGNIQQEVKQQIMAALPLIRSTAINAVSAEINRGGNMARQVGRRS